MTRRNLSDKLSRFDSQIATQQECRSIDKYPERYSLLAASLGGKLIIGPAGCYCLVRTFYPNGYVHGNCELNYKKDETVFPATAFSAKADDVEHPLDSMLFVDTETTGLGGSGAVAFLIGCARVIENGVEILQFVMPDYSDEVAMLEDVRSLFRPDTVIVSFNGAAFDLPILIDRMIINRVGRDLSYAYHIDLLHSARRLFRRRLKDCTLVNLEKHLFAFYRDDDIPGYLVPSVYFDWLNEQDTSQLGAVLEHNRNDIISLCFLLQLTCTAYVSEGASLKHVEDLHSLSRYYDRRREIDKVELVYRRVESIERGLTDDTGLFYAQNFKRIKNYTEATRLWEEIAAAKTIQGFRANVELAKYYEHRTKDFPIALKYAEAAKGCPDLAAKHLRLVQKRICRLNRKIESVAKVEKP